MGYPLHVYEIYFVPQQAYEFNEGKHQLDNFEITY